MTTATLSFLTSEQLESYERDGYLVLAGLFDDAELAEIQRKFDELADRGEPVPGFWEPDVTSDDPLKRYPRVMHPHRWDERAKAMMLKPEIERVLHDLLGEPAVACQTMHFYKPPGSPGQALHQDNFYLSVKPGNCIAAWTAVDPADPDNGGLFVVPGTHKMDIHCPDPDDAERTKSTNLVDPPKGMKAVPVVMDAGDTLFFNGSVVHGSGRNKTADRWRRSFISHYMPATSTHVSEHYFPIYSFDGEEITYEAADRGGPCGYKEGAEKFYNSYGVDATLSV